MPRMKKTEKEEWRFFLKKNGRKNYNELCSHCARSCKQSFRVKVIACPKYWSKRAAGEVTLD